MNEDQLNARNLSEYQRLTVWLDDLRNARFYVNFLLKKGWHFDPFDRKIRYSTYLQQAAFTTAFVISYCKPFAKSKGRPIFAIKSAKLEEHERSLHDKLLELRNTVYAHSDVELRNIRPIVIRDFPTALETLPSLKLREEECHLCLSLIAKVSTAIKARLTDSGISIKLEK